MRSGATDGKNISHDYMWIKNSWKQKMIPVCYKPQEFSTHFLTYTSKNELVTIFMCLLVVLFDSLVNYCIILKPKFIFLSIIGWSFRFIRLPLVLVLRLETTGVWWWVYGSLNWPKPSLLYKQSAAPSDPKCFMSTHHHLIRPTWSGSAGSRKNTKGSWKELTNQNINI